MLESPKPEDVAVTGELTPQIVPSGGLTMT
jgi:hypothetical protein